MVSHIALMQALAKFGRDEDGALRLIVTAAGGSPNASFTITRVDGVPNSDLIAPAGVMLRASNLAGFNVTEPAGNTNVYDPTQHQISYIWDFGDTAYTPRFTPNIPTAWRNTNIAYGKSVAHVYAAPGNYTVTCFAFDDAGNWGTATYTFQSGGNAGPILNPDTVFANALTAVFSPAGNFANKPANAVECTTIAQVNSAFAAAGARGRVLFRRGETYNFARDVGIGGGIGRQGMTSIYYGTYGTGNAPVLNVRGKGPFLMRDVNGGVCALDGLDIVGSWDAATETGTSDQMFAELGEFVQNLVIHRCLISGLGLIEFKAGDNTNWCYWLNDMRLTNWKDYGILGGTPRNFAVIGCDISQNVDALMGINQSQYGSQSPTNLGNTHGPMRSGNEAHLYVACTSFFSRNGWSSSGAGGNLPAVSQGTWRFTPETSRIGVPNFITYRGHHIHERCSHESGGVTITIGNVGDAESNLYHQNLVFDKCLFVGSAYGADGAGNAMVRSRQPGITMRNCYFYRPDVARRITANMFEDGIVWHNLTTGSIAALASVPSRFYNNTVWLPGTNSQIGSVAPVFVTANGNRTVENNVLFAPGLTSPLGPIGASFAPLSTSALAGFQCRFKGGRWNPPPIGSPDSPSGLLRCIDRRENPSVPGTLQPGPVAVGESVLLPYPNYTGQAGYTLNVTQSMILANATQRHQVSIVRIRTRRSDPALWPEGEGGVTISFQPTFIRVTNNTGVVWNWSQPGDSGSRIGDIWMQLDLSAQLMAFDTPSPADVPAPVPGTGSTARNGYTTGLRAREDFFGNVRAGERNTTGVIQGGTADLGAFEIA